MSKTHKLYSKDIPVFSSLFRLFIHLFRLTKRLLKPWSFASETLKQIHLTGTLSITVTTIVGIFIGMVVALQFHSVLIRFGATGMLGSAVGLSLVLELAPLLTGLIITARVGSSICSELGIMRSESQIDSLECMAIDPYAYLIVPRFLAIVIAAPALTAIFTMVGTFGGWLMATTIFDISHGSYVGAMADSVSSADIKVSMYKASVFGFLIAWICTAKGFLLHLDQPTLLGEVGVSKATTEAVVNTFISIFVADYFISSWIQ